MSRNGFTMTEALVALTIAALIAIIAIPALSETVKRSRLEAAARKMVYDVQAARSQAITTGWEYRIVGFDAGASSHKNSYRMLARSQGTVSWPSDTAQPMRTTTQFAGPWIDVPNSFPGVSIDTASARFEVTFDARGAATSSATFNPLQFNGSGGTSKRLTVSAVGGIEVQ